MSCITVRGCAIGQGRPNVILPIVEETQSAILARGRAFAALAADCVEFRAAWVAGWQGAAARAQGLAGLGGPGGDKLLLVTLRTRAEGGRAEASFPAYAAFCRHVWESGCADLVDL